jgi:hypothetical protein
LAPLLLISLCIVVAVDRRAPAYESRTSLLRTGREDYRRKIAGPNADGLAAALRDQPALTCREVTC